MQYTQLLKRADDEVLQSIVGTPVVRLLNAIDTRLATPAAMRELVNKVWAPEEVLRRDDARTRLLELMPPEDATSLVADLGLPTGDPFGQLRTLRPSKGSALEQRLFAALSVIPATVDEAIQPPASQPIFAKFGLFEHQREAIRRARSLLDGERRRVLLHMPTGSGKTRTAMHLVCQYLQSCEPSLVVWLAYSEELCEQAAQEFEKSWSHLGDRPIPLHRYWGDRHLDISEVRDGLVIAGLAKLHSRTQRDADFILRVADRAELVVFDEAHQAIAPTYEFVLETLLGRRSTTRLLGLSATPGRTWNDPDEDQRLADFFYRQKVTLDVPGFESPIDYLVTAGYLAKPEFRQLLYAGGVNLTDRDRRQVAEALDLPRALLERLAEDDQRNLLILDQVERLVREHDRVLVFAASVAHARLLAGVLGARGVWAEAVTSSTPSDLRSRLITRFRSDNAEPMVLINYGVLTTGFDAPRVSATVIARPTKSLVLYSQMVGRAIRGPKAGGNESALILTVVDTALPGFGQLAEAFMNWEDVW